ncbi:hypothetical protein BJF79_14410 [Actinomadura sp. CNU-125]|uniref:serine/threonine-protein kinase n=1 Tax=Actinomadura sp. CNU-125 TaxID=1904961 RepID=UPI00095CB523|nr:serine/threonine-protein kinase [Actinomadura sp. CNU-125]OLT23931.1 hypothetical protein BJF79_14410 [Actinomadura sp. CNU-125]
MINDRYRLDAPLGQGGMGIVWRGHDHALRRPVAVKQLLPPQGLDPGQERELRARFLREARSAASLDHPSVISIHDVIEDPGGPWIVMQFVQGRSLQQIVEKDGPLPADRVAEIGHALLDALECAHANGIVHRDLKPANVLVADDGRVVLTDFGIAAVAGATQSLTQTGRLIGSLGYIAPERFSDGTADGRADLWSLGATLYYCVEGGRAFRADEGPEVHIARLVMGERPEFARAGRLEPVIRGLLEKDPGRRPAIDQARRLLDNPSGRGTAFRATRTLPGRHLPARLPRRRTLIALPALLIVFTAAAAVGYTTLSEGSRGEAEGAEPAASTAVEFTTVPNICGALTNEPMLDDLIDRRGPGDSEITDDWRKCGWETEESAEVPVDGKLSISARLHTNVGEAEEYMDEERAEAPRSGGTDFWDYEPGEVGDRAMIRDGKDFIDRTIGGEVFIGMAMSHAVVCESNLVVEIRYWRSRGEDLKPGDNAATRDGTERVLKAVARVLERAARTH